MPHKLTEEEENENIKGETTETLMGAYLSKTGYFYTTPELKQKILEELFDRLVRLEPLEQAIINRRLHYERWLNERGYFGEWDSIEDLTKGKDNAYQFGIASGIYDVCTALLRMVEVRVPKVTRKTPTGGVKDVKPHLKKPTGDGLLKRKNES